MEKCNCDKCKCPNEVIEFGHRYEERNAIVEAEYQKDIDKAKSIIKKLCKYCEKGQHQGKPIIK